MKLVDTPVAGRARTSRRRDVLTFRRYESVWTLKVVCGGYIAKYKLHKLAEAKKKEKEKEKS